MQNINKEYNDIMNYVNSNKKRLAEKLAACPKGSQMYHEAKEELDDFNKNSEHLIEHYRNKLATAA